ncbi:MAG TPA: dihydroorotate dehydrogenase electron transfer subunit [bacterium]
MKFFGSVANILKNERITDKFFRLKLDINGIPAAKPGQFIMLKISHSTDPLLRRPFAIFHQNGKNIEIVYRIAGKGTCLLSAMGKGEKLSVLGPFGNGFGILNASPVLMVAGGTGIASLGMLAERIRGATLLFGAKSKDGTGLLRHFRKSGHKTMIATEDGSAGVKGMATDIFLKVDLKKFKKIYACGPIPMLKEVSRVAAKNKISCEVSLEGRMACGFGVCQGCVVPARNTEQEYLRVCAEGPVFDSGKISWEEIT